MSLWSTFGLLALLLLLLMMMMMMMMMLLLLLLLVRWLTTMFFFLVLLMLLVLTMWGSILRSISCSNAEFHRRRLMRMLLGPKLIRRSREWWRRWQWRWWRSRGPPF